MELVVEVLAGLVEHVERPAAILLLCRSCRIKSLLTSLGIPGDGSGRRNPTSDTMYRVRKKNSETEPSS